MKLEESDYLACYGLAYPKDIKKEFGEHSLGERQIQRIYRRYGLKPLDIVKPELVKDSNDYRPVDTPDNVWNAEIAASIATSWEITKDKIWEKINFRKGREIT